MLILALAAVTVEAIVHTTRSCNRELRGGRGFLAQETRNLPDALAATVKAG